MGLGGGVLCLAVEQAATLIAAFGPNDVAAPRHTPVRKRLFPARTRSTARRCSGERSAPPSQGTGAARPRDRDDTVELVGVGAEDRELVLGPAPPEKQLAASDGAGRGSQTVTFKSRGASGRRGGAAAAFCLGATLDGRQAWTGRLPRQACSLSLSAHSAPASAQVSVSWTQRDTDFQLSSLTQRKRRPRRPWTAPPPYMTSGGLQGSARGRGLVCRIRVCSPFGARHSSTTVSLAAWAATREPEASPCSTFTCARGEGAIRWQVGGWSLCQLAPVAPRPASSGPRAGCSDSDTTY